MTATVLANAKIVLPTAVVSGAVTLDGGLITAI
jgi:alpha-D-ribose 1-methylphosphonate 5-triphosphate diphosphatase PhnM